MKSKFKMIAVCVVAYLFAVSTYAQNLNYAIKAGPAENQVQVFLKPSANYGPTVIQQMTLVVGWESSCATTNPAVGWAGGSALTNPFMNSTYTEIEKTGTGTIGSTAYSFVEHTWSRTGGDFATWQAGTEYLLATVTFSGGAPSCPVSLLDFVDGGSTTSANTYIADHTGDYFTPTEGNSGFYPVTDTSMVSSGTNGIAATTASPVVLPLELVDFSARAGNDCQVGLQWITENETQFSHFEIEYSSDGVSFIGIGREPAKATIGRHSYHYGYAAPSGRGFYRLKMIDTDGRYKYSRIIVVHNCADSQAFDIFLYPNPSAGVVPLYLTLRQAGTGTVQVRVYDYSGKQVLQQEFGNSGSADVTFPVRGIAGLANGVYELRAINSAGEVVSRKFVKQ